MTKPDLPHHERWILWEIPHRVKTHGYAPAFDASDGWSTQALDHYIWGNDSNWNGLELCVWYRLDQPTINLTRGYYADTGRLAHAPLPETLRETIAWARMAAAMHTTDHDPRGDGSPFV